MRVNEIKKEEVWRKMRYFKGKRISRVSLMKRVVLVKEEGMRRFGRLQLI